MRYILLILIFGTFMLLSGCGGNGSDVASIQEASVGLQISWPERGRFIHTSAECVVIRAAVNGRGLNIVAGSPTVDHDPNPTVVQVNRSDSVGGVTSFSLDGLVAGPVVFSISTHSEANPENRGYELGNVAVRRMLASGMNQNLEFVLESQTAAVEVTVLPPGPVHRTGQILTVSAVSKQGTAIVIDQPDDFVFSVSDPSKLALVGANQVEVLDNGTSQISARERGNDSSGQNGSLTIRTDEFEQSEWTLTTTGLPVSNSGIPLFTPNPVFKGSIAYFAYGTGLLGVDSTGSWTQYPVTGLEPDVTRIELIGVGPMDELYVRGYVQTGAFTYSVRDIYEVSSGFMATRVANPLSGSIAGVFCVNRNGTFGSFVPSGDNSSWTLFQGPVATMSSWTFSGSLAKPNFQVLDSGGALVWNKIDGVTTAGSGFISALTAGSNTMQTITPPPGFSEVAIATMNQEGYWKGTAKGGVGTPTVIGRNGQILHVAQGEGAQVYTTFPGPSGVTPHLVYENGQPHHWEVFSPGTGWSWTVELGSTDLTALGIHTVVNGGVMVATYQGKVAILKRTN